MDRIFAPMNFIITAYLPVTAERMGNSFCLLPAMEGGVSNALVWSFCTAKTPKLKIIRVYSTEPQSGEGSPLDDDF